MPLASAPTASVLPLHVLTPDGLTAWLQGAEAPVRTWVEAQGFRAGLGETLAVPAADGRIACALAGWGDAAARKRDRFHLARAAEKLPPAIYA